MNRESASDDSQRRWPRRLRWILAPFALLCSLLLFSGLAGPVRCNLYAAQNGSDEFGDGSKSRPFASLVKLEDELAAGEVGCLRAGTYGNTGTWHKLRKSGTPLGRITITSAPGELATVSGYVDMEGSYTTLGHLRIDGSNTLYGQHPGGVPCRRNVSQSLVIAGHDDTLEYDDYFQSIPMLRANGIGIGFWGTGDNATIRYSRIHDVGQCQAYDHIIYVSHGNNVRIYGNWLYGDRHGRGVQLYPAPTGARVWGNAIDHVGEGFVIGDEPGDTVRGNEIYANIISNTTGLSAESIPPEVIHDLYGGIPGANNSFHDNVSFHNLGGIGHLTHVLAYANTIANPHYVNAASHDYRVEVGPLRRMPMPGPGPN